MSIADEITRLQTAKANIKTAINNKGGSLTNETISLMLLQLIIYLLEFNY